MTKKIAAIVAACVLVVGVVFFAAVPQGRALWNSWFSNVQKVDDQTNYKTQKQVEDTCRAMISSYQADKLMYEQYQNSEDKEKTNWAEQARTRANRTASSYNNYVLKNQKVWSGNVPADIAVELPYL